MKYKYVTAVLLAGVLLFGGCAKQTKIANEEAYVKLNSMVKDIDFLTGRIENATLTLKDSSGKCVFTASVEEELKTIGNIRFHKSGNVIYYVLLGSVDDEDGIMFINGAENGVLGGVKKVERIGGNYYRYSTYD